MLISAHKKTLATVCPGSSDPFYIASLLGPLLPGHTVFLCLGREACAGVRVRPCGGVQEAQHGLHRRAAHLSRTFWGTHCVVWLNN